MLNFWLSKGININVQDQETGMTALHMVVHFTNIPEQIKFLLAHGANPNIRDKKGMTPLDLVHDGQKTSISLLKQRFNEEAKLLDDTHS